MSLSVAVVGCGTGGPAAALLLAEAGHRVEVLERFEDPSPVGAGLLLQPTGMAVLRRLGLLEPVLARGARIERLLGDTTGGRRVMDLSYADLGPGVFGLGIHRAVLFDALWGALAERGIPVRLGAQVTGADRGTLRLAGGATLGPYDLVVAADGARSCLRAPTGLVRRARPYPWGALWTILDDPEQRHAGALAQVYRGTGEMLGFLASGRPAGTPRVSLFWSIRVDAVAATRARGLTAWKAQVRSLTTRADHLLDQLTDIEQLLPATYMDVVMRRWHADRLAFVGDAGHAMSPQLGQGVNLALLDALALSRALTGHPALPEALAAYSARRRAHLRFYSWASRAMTPFFQSSLGALAPPRDLLVQPVSKLPWASRQFVSTLAGAKTGLFGTIDPEAP